MRLFRLTGLNQPTIESAFSGEGGKHAAGRWNSLGTPLVYASTSESLACLETLVHLPSHRSLGERLLYTLDVPDKYCAEQKPEKLPEDWKSLPPSPNTQELGDTWFREQQSIVLLVPSVIIPHENNALINTRHPAFDWKLVGGPSAFAYDVRLKQKSRKSAS
ncbi:MAG: RES family NAD+ phosphorylase [Candidatus Methylacidiphilales bacterium]